jgi:transposase
MQEPMHQIRFRAPLDWRLQRGSLKDRAFIKGQRYTLLAHRENLSHHGRTNLRKLLQANKRLNVAYLLKESFGQLWDYRTEDWARAFFERWKQALRWQRLFTS